MRSRKIALTSSISRPSLPFKAQSAPLVRPLSLCGRAGFRKGQTEAREPAAERPSARLSAFLFV